MSAKSNELCSASGCPSFDILQLRIVIMVESRGARARSERTESLLPRPVCLVPVMWIAGHSPVLLTAVANGWVAELVPVPSWRSHRKGPAFVNPILCKQYHQQRD